MAVFWDRVDWCPGHLTLIFFILQNIFPFQCRRLLSTGMKFQVRIHRCYWDVLFLAY